MIRLSARPPFDATATLAALRAHATPGLERVTADSYERLWPVAGEPRFVRVFLDEDGARMEGALLDGEVPDGLRRRLATLLDLDHDPATVEFLALDPLLAPGYRPGIRIVGFASAFEGAVTTVLGQQVSLAACRTFTARLVARWGTPGPEGLRSFPTPAQLAAAPADELRATIGLTSARAATLADVVALFAGGFDPTDGDFAPSSALGRLRGIGPWTLDYLRLRTRQDADCFVPGDLVARRAMGVSTAAEASAIAERWRPARGYALLQLWTRAGYLRA